MEESCLYLDCFVTYVLIHLHQLNTISIEISNNPYSKFSSHEVNIYNS